MEPTTPPALSTLARRQRLEALRQRIRGLESGAPAHVPAHARGPRTVALGLAAIDRALPGGGLAAGALHEVLGGSTTSALPDGAATGFALAVLGRFAGARPGAPVLWCRRGGRAGRFHGAGLAALGLAPGRLIVAEAERPRDLFWAIEEGLASGAPAAVLGELDGLAAKPARRLQLAAEKHGVPALVLRTDAHHAEAAPVATRWHIRPLPAPDDSAGGAVWQVTLLRCRGALAGLPMTWSAGWTPGEGLRAWPPGSG